jgi:flagellar FliL protein
MANEVKEKPATGKSRTWLVLGIVAVLATAAGAGLPHLLHGLGTDGELGKLDAKHGKMTKPAFLSFGDVVVNLNDGRLNRYLRVRILLVIDHAEEKIIAELLGQQKAILKNWLITYLRDRSLDEVKGAAGVNRLRREIQDRFNTLLFTDGTDRIQDVLFEEFVIQ